MRGDFDPDLSAGAPLFCASPIRGFCCNGLKSPPRADRRAACEPPSLACQHRLGGGQSALASAFLVRLR
eukprot:4507372-Pleurochrysis_carterae.AAC.1